MYGSKNHFFIFVLDGKQIISLHNIDVDYLYFIVIKTKVYLKWLHGVFEKDKIEGVFGVLLMLWLFVATTLLCAYSLPVTATIIVHTKLHCYYCSYVIL